MKRLSLVVVGLVLMLGCEWGEKNSKSQSDCQLGFNLAQSRGDVVKAIQAKIDSLVEYRKKDVKGKTKSKEWVCDVKLEELRKLLQDFQQLPAQQERQPGFLYVEDKLITAVKKYGLGHYINIADAWCKGQLLFLECTFASPQNVSFVTKRVVQFNKKEMYDVAPDADMFITTYKQSRREHVVPDHIYVVFCLRSDSPANPNDISRIKSLHPHEKIYIEGEFDGFQNKMIHTDLGGGVERPEVNCAYLKNWVIRSPEYINNN